MAIVRDLFIYPLKSARGIAQSAVRLSDTGFSWDRHWLAIDAKGTFLTQRTHPRLAVVEPRLDGDSLTLCAQGFENLRLPLEPHGTKIDVRIWKDLCTGLDQGEQASAWISEVLGSPTRIVRMPPSMDRHADPNYAGPAPVPVSYPDAFPILVCNTASLDELNTRMPEPIPMARFRPNLVIEGLPAFAEDRIHAVRVNGVTLRLVKPCTRCIVPSTDQVTGERSTDPLPVLRQFRFDRALRGVTFGENAIVAEGAGGSIVRGAECSLEYEA